MHNIMFTYPYWYCFNLLSQCYVLQRLWTSQRDFPPQLDQLPIMKRGDSIGSLNFELWSCHTCTTRNLLIRDDFSVTYLQTVTNIPLTNAIHNDIHFFVMDEPTGYLQTRDDFIRIVTVYDFEFVIL
jgi:hypothetical protein